MLSKILHSSEHSLKRQKHHGTRGAAAVGALEPQGNAISLPWPLGDGY
jgi:hypothetical protein